MSMMIMFDGFDDGVDDDHGVMMVRQEELPLFPSEGTTKTRS